MTQALRELLSDPWFYVMLVTVGSLGTFALRRVIKNAVDHQFGIRIESHKHDLGLIAERERYELQRRLAGAAHYLARQHAAAADVYSAVRIAHGAVGKLLGAQRAYALEDCNKEDLRELLDGSGALSGKRDELLASWSQDPKEGIDQIREHLRDLAVPFAERKLQEARNMMYINEIYFSDEAIAALDGFVEECNKWILRRQIPPRRGEKLDPLSRDALNDSLDRVQRSLRAELSGHGP